LNLKSEVCFNKDVALAHLTNPQLLIIFTTAPAGLGHLRVTDALQEGLPPDVHTFVLGASDPTLTYLHRLSSLNPIFRRLQYFIQYHRAAEQIFTDFYRRSLRRHTDQTYLQLSTLLTTHQPATKTAVIVATHFGLAHEIAAIKDQLQKETHVQILLVVVVTDDTFQKVWAVDGADIIAVPSQLTRKLLSAYFEEKRLPRPKITVIPYPVSPKFCPQSHSAQLGRKKQLDINSRTATQILVPVSGAAVQLTYLESLIKHLCTCPEKPFHISVVTKLAPFTKTFLTHIQTYPNLTVVTGGTDRQAVDLYEDLFFKDKLPSLEITKPSEHTFKVLLEPRQAGGVLMLFTAPVGRHEIDNLAFLLRHGLIPNQAETETLYTALLKDTPEFPATLTERATGWRGLILPEGAQQSARFIGNCRTLGVFTQMLKYRRSEDKELACNGVAQFWKKIDQSLERLPARKGKTQ
jgi:hypothetical protein